MLVKLLEQVFTRFVDSVAKRPYGATLLVVAAVVGGTFLLLQYLRATPTALMTLLDPVFYSVSASVVTFGLAIALMQASRLPRLVAVIAPLSVAGLFGWGLGISIATQHLHSRLTSSLMKRYFSTPRW